MNRFFWIVAVAGAVGLAGCEETASELETAGERAEGETVAVGEEVQEQSERQVERTEEEIADPGQVQPVAGQQEPQQPPQNLAPGETVAALQAINAAEIEEAELARERAESTEVRDFAQRMIQDHTRSQEQLTSILRDSDLQPQEGQVTQRLQQESQQLMSRLREQRGADFDRAYIDAQVREHRDAVALLDANMDRVEDPQLSSFLRQQRGAIEQHRQMAEEVQRTAGTMAAGGQGQGQTTR